MKEHVMSQVELSFENSCSKPAAVSIEHSTNGKPTVTCEGSSGLYEWDMCATLRSTVTSLTSAPVPKSAAFTQQAGCQQGPFLPALPSYPYTKCFLLSNGLGQISVDNGQGIFPRALGDTFVERSFLF